MYGSYSSYLTVDAWDKGLTSRSTFREPLHNSAGYQVIYILGVGLVKSCKYLTKLVKNSLVQNILWSDILWMYQKG